MAMPELITHVSNAFNISMLGTFLSLVKYYTLFATDQVALNKLLPDH